MTVQNSVAARNGRLDSFETTVGPSPVLRFFTGGMPANCATADSGTKLAEFSLPVDWLSAASGGVKSKLGTWSGAGLAAGNIGYYRLYDSGVTACHEQGTVTDPIVNTGDMIVDNDVIAVNQTFTVTSYSRIAGNA